MSKKICYSTVGVITAIFVGLCGGVWAADEAEPPVQYVADTVQGAVDTTTGIFTGKTKIEFPRQPQADPDDYERNALGERVPKSTLIGTGDESPADTPL